ncbi:hypothetical protein ACFY1G_16005 [Streptomyces olivaceus]|uniref:Uncharacterized protein n=1 Tax=Streptomyces olivaceus TaxID=47716 RepID=A0ABS7W6R9_STROV|nr:hypothetical protein [Streptomyces olivaceus]MBZ6090804.1 hypothetical protein [Streptomyces olivaceus]MBZ6096979.1 hypothetical protein [Streptomyces olivaceus]MBZ6119484.1 hypothetical protein [Streptomyces olivaceus]MBZ6153304.1 hypothetical protein [Streptomyces olivaceus]MBZ6204537.1 hypothetical protein [Streptomyces olivaceus]
MTQSGQGEEPSPRQAREGIVLPSDGGEPLLPGLAGQPVAPQAGGPVPTSAPPGGQAWDRPWGPEQQSPDSGQGWPAPPGAQSWGASGTAQPSSPPPVEAATQTWPPMPGGQAEAPGALPSRSGPGPLPPEGTQSPAYGTPAGTYGGQPSYQQHEQQQHQQHEQHQHEQQQAYQQQQPYQQHGQQQHHEPYQQHQQNQGHYQQQAQHYGGQGAASLPPADEGATQLIPPVPIPADEGATQYIPPVGPGALPPEQPAQAHAESTRFLGRQSPYPAQPAPSAPPPPAAHSDAEATQYIAPVPGGPAGDPYGAAPGGDEGRQPPAEFDNLFRSAPGADGAASATQQLPQFDQPQQYQPAGPAGYAPQGPGGPGGPGGGKRRGNGGGGRGGRTGSRMPLFAAVGVGIAVVGVGAGAMMAGGGDDGDKGANQTVSATADASESASASASAPPDPVREQAVELDKLLAESGTGRTTVINAVGDVKSCENLPEAAKDLREAAKQRNGLVESLSELSVDKLPQHTELTTALTKAWKASASADDHYAAWADQAAGKKGCKKGQARTTKETQAGNRESGTASKEKTKAAGLWNAIAKKYGLTERQPTQL